MKNLSTILSLIALFAAQSAAFADGGGMMAQPFEEAAPRDPLDGLKLSENHFEACADKAFISDSTYRRDKAFWDRAIKECSDANIEVLPDTGFFSMFVNKFNEQDHENKAMDFLRKVGEKVKADMSVNIANLQKQVACLESPKSEGCSSVISALKANVEKVNPGLRQALALSEYENRGQRVEKPNAEDNINDQMKYPTAALSFKAVVQPLSDDEKKAAAAAYEADTQAIHGEWDAYVARKEKQIQDRRAKGVSEADLGRIFNDSYHKIKGWKGNYNNPDYNAFLMKARAEKFTKHRGDFVAGIYAAPILAFLGKPDALANCSAGKAEDCKLAADAAKKLLENNMEQRAKVEEAMKPTRQVGRAAKRKGAGDMLDLMSFGPQVKGVLAQDKSYCQSANGLQNLVNNKGTKDTTMVAGAAVGAFLVMGPGAGAALGATGAGVAAVNAATVLGFVAAGTGTIVGTGYHEYKVVQDQDQKFLNRATDQDGEAMTDIKTFQDAQDAYVLSSALQPLNLIGTGAAGLLGGYATKQAAKAAASHAMQSGLAQKGMTKEAIAKLTSDLNSKDPEIAAAATRALVKESGWTDEAINVVRQAASKNLISVFTHRKAMAAIKAEIKDAKTATAAIEALKKINSAKLNDGNRMDALEAALFGAKFFSKDASKGATKGPAFVEALANKINDWDQGLDGLAATYKLAASKMDLAEVKALGSLEARQDKAIRLAIRDELKNNPEYQAASKEGKEAMEDQLASCGIVR